MNFSSSLLYDFGIPPNSGNPEVNDNNIRLVPLMDVGDLTRALRHVPGASDVVTVSGIVGINAAATNAQNTVTAATISSGLWLVSMSMSFYSNFLDLAAGEQSNLQLLDPAGNITNLLTWRSLLNVGQMQSWSGLLLLTGGNWTIRTVMNAGGAGNTVQLTGSILFNRKL